MQAIDAENMGVTRPLHLEPTPSLGIGTTSSQGSQRSMGHRKFVDFSSAKKTEERERVARVTKKRGQVYIQFTLTEEHLVLPHMINQCSLLPPNKGWL